MDNANEKWTAIRAKHEDIKTRYPYLDNYYHTAVEKMLEEEGVPEEKFTRVRLGEVLKMGSWNDHYGIEILKQID